jgi:hypothetical protein
MYLISSVCNKVLKHTVTFKNWNSLKFDWFKTIQMLKGPTFLAAIQNTIETEQITSDQNYSNHILMPKNG